MRACAVVVVTLLLAGCAAVDTAMTTSSTSLAAPATSTTTSSTPTTIPPTSTTSSLPPTSTTTLLDGTWGELPLVAYDDWGGIALGWWDGSNWIQADNGTSLPISGGEDYQVVLLWSEGLLEGSSPTATGCDVVMPEGLPGVQFDSGKALRMIVDDGRGGDRTVSGVAITAPWQLTPRPVAPGESHPDFESAAVELLGERGYVTDRVEILQSVDADLDGDGTIETLLVAEETELGNEMSGVYSIVFAVSPSWDSPAVVVESVIPPDDTGFPASLRVSAVADLSGDGMMEVVVDGQAWETGWVTVHELIDAGFQERIGAGCGV